MPIVKDLKDNKILLDTHVLLWSMMGSAELTTDFRKAFQRAIDHERAFIAPITAWEISLLAEKKRIELRMDTQEWMDRVESLGIHVAPFSIRIAVGSSRLPGTLHADPADRILISTAHEINAVLVTCDRKILEYAHDRFITAYDPKN